MRIAGGLPGHGAQAEAAIRRVVGGLQPAVIEHEGLALALLEIELAVIRTADRVRHDPPDLVFGSVELAEKAVHVAPLSWM
jgi:hypothetical protein